MLEKMWRKDIARNKLVTAILCMFIMISSLLVASSASMLLELFRSVDDWFEKAGVPHFVQMHAGEIDQQEIEDFASRSKLVKEQQTVEMISIEPLMFILRQRRVRGGQRHGNEPCEAKQSVRFFT